MAQLGINRHSALPCYQQLGRLIEEGIERGEFPRGRFLPSERELCRRYALSRITVKQSLAELERKGVVKRIASKGTRVADTTPGEVCVSVAYTDSLLARPGAWRMRLLSVERADAADERCAFVDEGARRELQKVILVERLQCLGRVRVAHNLDVLPFDLCPGLLREDLNRRMIDTLLTTKYGFQLGALHATYRARMLSAEESRLLRLDGPAPGLEVQETLFLHNGKPARWTRAVFRGTHYQLTLRYAHCDKITNR